MCLPSGTYSEVATPDDTTAWPGVTQAITLPGARTQGAVTLTEDADMAKTMVDFSTQQAVYQSALRAGAQIIQPSLMDFLSSN